MKQNYERGTLRPFSTIFARPRRPCLLACSIFPPACVVGEILSARVFYFWQRNRECDRQRRERILGAVRSHSRRSFVALVREPARRNTASYIIGTGSRARKFLQRAKSHRPGLYQRTKVKYLIQPGLTGPQTPVPIGDRDNWVHFAQNVFHLQEVPAVPR